MKKLPLLITVSLILISASMVTGDNGPSYFPTLEEAKITNAKVFVGVSMDSRGIYTYVYTVSNLSIGQYKKIANVSIDISFPQGGMSVTAGGIEQGPRTEQIGPHDSPPEGNVVLVGIWSPPGWDARYNIPPKEFIETLGHIGDAFWSPTCRYKCIGIAPNEYSKGFILYSYGLPGIRKFTLGSTFIPVEGRDFPENWSAGQFQHWIMTEGQTVNFTGMTVGPSVPPANFVPVDFLNYIISLKQQSYQFGWIVQNNEDEHDKDKSKEKPKKGKDDKNKEIGIMQSLDTKLNHAKAALEAGNTKQAVNILSAFVDEIDGLYNVCREHEEHDGDRDGHDKDSKGKDKGHNLEIASQKKLAMTTAQKIASPLKADRNDKTYEHCDKSHLTSEAYALLKYNTEYLIDRLGGKTRGHEKEDREGSTGKANDKK